jgi:hypothetical protein
MTGEELTKDLKENEPEPDFTKLRKNISRTKAISAIEHLP